MNELERIVGEADRLRMEGASFLVATVVRVRGSSYRRPGARMLVSGDRWIAGCVSGGCLEGDVLLRGAHRCRDGAVVASYDSSDTAESWSLGLGCGGIVDLLLEHVEAGAMHEGLAFAKACFDAESSGSLATVIESSRVDVPVGARLAIGPGSDLIRLVGDVAVRHALEQAARGATGVIEIDGLGITVLVEHIAPSPQLFVLGSGHDAVPLVALGESVGMRVTVADRTVRDPARFGGAHRVVSTGGDWTRLSIMIDAAASAHVVIMHHQRESDREALRAAIASHASYIGVLGPARRCRELLAEIDANAPDSRIHAPAGLDIGAETPEQVALAIVAEIQAAQRGLPAGRLRDRVRALHADVAVAVLAAGASRRLGHPKQLVEVDGEPLVRRVAGACVESGVGPVGVVVGADASAVAAAFDGVRAAALENADWPVGIASSIRRGVEWAESTNAGALLVVLGDQPMVEAAHLVAMRDAWLAGADYVASRFGGVLGAPALFDRSRWHELAALDGDEGAARILRNRNVVAIDCPAAAVDIDTDADVALLQATSGSPAMSLSRVIG